MPFVGCRSDGQTGPQEAPTGPDVSLPIGLKASTELAYFATYDIRVLAPRGWRCFGTSGSGGYSLYVSPEPINGASLRSEGWSGFAGPVIAIHHTFGGTSGRFEVARVIARVFPAYKAFVTQVIDDGFGFTTSFPFGPYPKDALRYQSKSVVEYTTPPETEGLGTGPWLRKSGSPIEGVAILTGDAPDLTLLSVRLPRALSEFAMVIIRQVERDAPHFPG